MNFVQTGYDLDENFIADLIIRDQNKSDQDLNVNEMNFVQPNYNLDEDFIMDLIRVDPNKSDSYAEESLPTFYNSSSSPQEANMKHFNSLSPNPPSYYFDPTPSISQPFETEQFDDKGNIQTMLSNNITYQPMIFGHNEARMDSTYYHPHQTNVKQHEFIKYVQHSIPEELKKLILETNQDRGVKFINDNQIIVDTHIFNMKTKVQNKQGGRFVKWACAKEGCRFSLVTVEGRIKSHSRLQTLKNRKHTHSIKNDTIEIDIPILNNIDNQNTKQLLNNICNNLKSSMIWRPWL